MGLLAFVLTAVCLGLLWLPSVTRLRRFLRLYYTPKKDATNHIFHLGSLFQNRNSLPGKKPFPGAVLGLGTSLPLVAELSQKKSQALGQAGQKNGDLLDVGFLWAV